MVNSLFNNRLDDIIIKNSKQLVFMLFFPRLTNYCYSSSYRLRNNNIDFFVLGDLILCKMIFELCHIWGQTKGRSGLCYIKSIRVLSNGNTQNRR